MINFEQFSPRARPGQDLLQGKFVRVEPVDWSRHGDDLAASFLGKENKYLWTYMSPYPPKNSEDFISIMQLSSQRFGWEVMVIISETTGLAVGMASFMRIREAHGSVEVGFIMFGAALQKTCAATEAMYLMMRHAFEDLGYRRYEWKCDNLNEASKNAALRFGFTYEGLFRQDLIIKGKNRDTAWFSITDKEWPAVKRGLEAWLKPENFDKDGRQKSRLKSLMP